MQIQDLFAIPLFDDCTDDELAWLARNSSEVQLERGDFFAREGDPQSRFYVVIEGELQITRTINGEEMVLGTTPRGIMGGENPLLSGGPMNVNARAIAPSRLIVFDRRAFLGIFANCPTVGMRILRTAAERTQGMAALLKQQEKLAALGKLSAGLAHELNNPAAAVRRAAANLREALPQLQAHTARLGTLGLNAAQIDRLVDVQRQAAAHAAPLSTIERADREETLGAWLEEHGVDDAWDLAPTFVSAGLAEDDLEALASLAPSGATPDVFAWLHMALSADTLLGEIDTSSSRISELIGAVKTYTFMDQAKLQEVDLHKGIEDTLTVLSHKLKSVTLVREYDPELPRVEARGAELNQVWTNLIDNAIDAMGGKGTVRLITRCENNFAMVEVADNGPGIPPEVLPRIFEPFFTTKGVGAGSGLGLDISHRIIRQHNGTIEVQSQPGQTRFIVRLPVGRSQ
jgi:signal transduction histidine kinase